MKGIYNYVFSQIVAAFRPILDNAGRRGCNKVTDACGNIDTEGLLTIPHFTQKDEGVYACTVLTQNNDTLTELRHIQIGGIILLQVSHLNTF